MEIDTILKSNKASWPKKRKKEDDLDQFVDAEVSQLREEMLNAAELDEQANREKLPALTGRAGRRPSRSSHTHTRHAQSHKGSAKCAASTPMRRWPLLQPTSGTLIGRPSSGPSAISLAHLTHRPHTLRAAAHQRATQMQIQTATWPSTGMPYWGTRPSPTAAQFPLKAARHCPL